MPELELADRVTALLEGQQELLADPFPVYAELRALESPYVHPSGPTVVVSRFDQLKEALSNSEELSNRGLAVGSRAEAIRNQLGPDDQRIFDEVATFENLYVSRADGDLHARVRKIAQRAFSPRKMAELGDRASEYTQSLIDDMLETGNDDWVDAVSSRLPMMMICSLLDVPLSDLDLIRGWTAKIGKNRGGTVLADLREAHEALGEFRAYVTELVEDHRRTKDHSELVSSLTGAAATGELSEEELLATMVVLLFGGSDTTSALLANGVAAVLAQPAVWEDLVASVQKGETRAPLEELIRYITPVQTLWRVAISDTAIGGREIPAGTTVLLVLGAGNRDEAVFDAPNQLLLDRSPNHHLGFGHGIHFCVGAALARLEGQTVLEHLANRLPDMRLKRSPSVGDWQGNIQFRALSTLRVDLQP